MGLFELALIAALVSFAGFLSASEVALFSLSRFQMRYLRETSRAVHRRIKTLLSDPAGLLITVLVANEVANILISSIIAEGIAHRWLTGGSRIVDYLPSRWTLHWPEWLGQSVEGLLISTPLILIFCEMTPKALGTRMNQIIAPLVVRPTDWLYRAFAPLRKLIEKIINVILRGVTPQELGAEGQQEILKEDEFLVLVEQGQKEGSINQTEVDLIKNVFNLDDTRVRDVYTPLSRAFTLHNKMKMNDILNALKHRVHSRVPVLDSQTREVVGILYKKDIIFDRLEKDISTLSVDEYLRKPYFVSASMQLNTLFRQMRNQKNHIAIVQDDKTGKSIGLVTMRDVLYELFDEYFPEKEKIR